MPPNKSEVSDQALLKRIRDVIRLEADTVRAQLGCVNKNFVQAVRLMTRCHGRVVVLGVGKSGLIGRKITATLASTGTPSTFVHPSEGMHGDLGMITPRDVVLALSFSGETEELKRLLPSIQSMRVPLIALTGKAHSRLARAATVLLLVSVKREACRYNLTPTTSTTAMLAVGDALSMAVMDARGFKEEDFARLHPGGILGKRLLWTVKDLMHRGKGKPGGAARSRRAGRAPSDDANKDGRDERDRIAAVIWWVILRTVILGVLLPRSPIFFRRK